MSDLNPLNNEHSGFPLTVPSAFRAWAAWTSDVGVGALQVSGIYQSLGALPALPTVPEGRGDLLARVARIDAARKPRKRILDALSEVYARAIMECALGLEFDQKDSCVDTHVLGLIEQLYSLDAAREVHERVAARGPVIRTFATQVSAEADSAVPALSSASEPTPG